MIFKEHLWTTASVFIERNFNIKKPNFNRCQEKKLRKNSLRKGFGLELGLGLRFWEGFFPRTILIGHCGFSRNKSYVKMEIT